MVDEVLLALAILSLMIWIALALFHGGFWRVTAQRGYPDPAHWPAVAAIVPARNECEVIAAAMEGLLLQDYPGRFHVVLVDDHSSDGTAELAAATARRLAREPHLAIVHARETPPGWMGKVWAQSEGLAAQRELLPEARYAWLTDADIGHDRQALRRLVACAEAEQRVLTSLMARLRCDSLPERALVPAFVFFFAMLYPFSRVNDPRCRVAAAAGGCMLARIDALQAAGGFAAIRDALIDDCALARQMKRQGPIRLDLAQDSLSLRPYPDWSSLWNMIARSAYTQLRYSRCLLMGTVLGMLATYLAPPLLILRMGYAAWPASMAWLIMMAVYMPMLRYYRRSLWWAPALPLVALFYLGATLASAWRYHLGRGGQWKGRTQALRRPSQRR
jgi:hopene-associated glycosyltransferase HpnB